MKIKINTLEKEFPRGTKLAAVVRVIRESQKDDPVTKSLMAKTGRDYITFMLNGRVVQAEEFENIELKPGDSIRWMHPYAGG